MASLADIRKTLDADAAGRSMHAFAAELYPICRSITGEGLRETLRRIGRRIPLEMRQVPSGTAVLDWEVPDEWNIRDAYIADASGNRVVDFQAHNLHVLNYSEPVDREMTWAELEPHLFSIPEQPDWIPYRTAYYARRWGFCLRHRTLEALRARGSEVRYRVVVDATLQPGRLNYGEVLLEGELDRDVLLSCHSCHPSLANDNLSGISLAVELAERLMRVERRFTYRFLFIPGTIGSITWLAQNEASADRITHGLVLTCAGDPGPSTYKRSRRGDATVDRAAEHVLRHSGGSYSVRPFVPYGYDERQYCSPGFDLPVGCLMRTPNGEYPEYHTSADDLALITPDALADSLDKLLRIVEILESDRRYRNLSPRGEPRLGKRGLYRPIGGAMGPGDFDQMALLWVLNQSDGRHSLLDIAVRAEMPFDQIAAAARALMDAGLLEAVDS